MKKSFLILTTLCLLIFGQSMAQNAVTKARLLPEMDVKLLDGSVVKTTNLLNQKGLTIINFWATWCKPCVLELNNIKEVFADWQKETGVKLIAVSIDDSRTMAKVGPVVSGKGWVYDIVLDPNSELKRKLNVVNPPHTFVVNSKGEIVWQHSSYSPGDEDELFEFIKKYTASNP
ncbi:MAG TPA: TlpA disulfide reductase family protein [Catalimonadaceae bacterium]|jgi:cytochrome c biogenesis protein CcmG/thiol:disulfide interchange protein DsbE|nr:TlpA disulfide reductase family protein [Catalimonadaceae bacterium]